MRMKISETVTQTEMKSLLIESAVIGLFPSLITNDDPYHALAYPMCLSFYTAHSHQKVLSPVYQRLFVWAKDDPSIIPNDVMGKVIRSQFHDKWMKSYAALQAAYTPTDDYSETERHTGENSDATNHGHVVTDGGENVETTEFGSGYTEVTKEDTYEITSRTGTDNASSVYGFNSSTAVPDSETTVDITDVTRGTGEDNKTRTENDKRGTDTTTRRMGTTETHSGTDLVHHHFNENWERFGRHSDAQTLVQRELDLRSKNQFIKMVLNDVASVAALQIYI